MGKVQITPEAFANLMRTALDKPDDEARMAKASLMMCLTLEGLGYTEGCRLFREWLDR